MGLPTPDLSWTTDLNVIHRTLGLGWKDYRESAVLLKDTFKAMAVPWTVSGSGNKSASGMDAVDRITDYTDMSWGNGSFDGTSNLSWFVLRQSAISPKFEVLFYPYNYWYGGTSVYIYMSPAAGFGAANGGTDGGLTSRPTATDEILIANQHPWLSGIGADNPATIEPAFRAWQSADGKQNRVFAWNILTQQNTMHVMFDVPKNPIPEWTAPVLGMWRSDDVAMNSYANLRNTAILYGNKPGGGGMTFYHTGEGFNANASGVKNTGLNELSSSYEMFPVGLYSMTSGAKGRHGEVYDMWWVPQSIVDGGVTMPVTPSITHEFGVYDDIAMVHDGVAPVLI